MDIHNEHRCVFCSHDEPHEVEISCTNDKGGHTYSPPRSTAVMFGQIHDGAAVVTIHDDLTADEIALLMSAFMDRISKFEHIKRDPSKIMSALMSGMQ